MRLACGRVGEACFTEVGKFNQLWAGPSAVCAEPASKNSGEHKPAGSMVFRFFLSALDYGHGGFKCL